MSVVATTPPRCEEKTKTKTKTDKMDHFPATNSRIIANQPTSTADSPTDEPMAEADEPPDDYFNTIPANEFKKIAFPAAMIRKQSLLTKTLHTDDDNEDDEDEDEPLFSGSNRAHSSASTWSRGSTADLTSDGHVSEGRTRSPSPQRHVVKPVVFNHESFRVPSTVKIAGAPSIDPLKKTATPTSSNEETVEKGLGRKRCIMFACGGNEATAGKKEEVKVEVKVEEKKDEEPPKRKCALKFVCPGRGNNTTPTANGAIKPHIRLASPPPPTSAQRIPASPRMVSPKVSRSHRSSDSTVRNDSPKSVRKVPSVLRRRPSNVSEVPISEATRFHEFASSEEERDDWTQEASCYRGRLTIQDTLKVENDLRHVCEEADEEAMEEEEAEEQAEDLEAGDIDEDDEDAEEDDRSMVDSTGYVTDDGFHTDDEEGFGHSDNDSDADSDYAWWAPAAASGEHLEHIRPSTRRSESGSSIGSFSSTRVFPSKTPKALKRSKTNPIEFRPRTPELPDSTDFVCGTLDEDRPLEEAWLSCRNQRRAAMHRPCPQDIDPTFPESDPEMDEEDEEGYEDAVHMDDSDVNFFHEHMSDIDEPGHGRGRERGVGSVVPMKRSPVVSPRRFRSPPPPAKRAVHRSPPPPAKRVVHRSPPPPVKRAVHRSPPPPTTASKRPVLRSPPPSKARLHSPPPPQAAAGAPRHLLFGHSPRRMHSPPPHVRRALHSPPPSRRTSLTENSPPPTNALPTPIALAQRPHHPSLSRETSSLPRNGAFPGHRNTYFDASSNSSNEDEATETDLPARMVERRAIDIVKGLEKKRARRKEKLYEKACRLKAKQLGHGKKREDVVLPGQGAEKMKRMGEAMCKARGGVNGNGNGNGNGIGIGRKVGVDHAIFSDDGLPAEHMLSY